MVYKVKFNNRLKYGNVPTEYRGGRFQSKKEARKAMELDMMKKGKAIKDWKPQHRLSLDVNGVHIANYYVDFMITHNDGSIEYLEIKSYITKTPVWRLKWKLSQALYDDPTITWTVEM